MTTESEIYKKLGPHPRLVKIIDWDPKECVLTIEYMPNGCLKDYLSIVRTPDTHKTATPGDTRGG